MTRLLLIAMAVLLIGCKPSSAPVPSSSKPAKPPTDTITHGRVTLLKYKIEMGNPDAAAAIRKGMDGAVSTLDDILADEELKPATGTVIGRFRLDADGTVRMFLTDKATSISNIDEDKLTDAFIKAAFAGKCSFPDLGDIAMVYAEFKINPPE